MKVRLVGWGGAGVLRHARKCAGYRPGGGR